MADLSYLTNAHIDYIESLYEQYQEDPGAVDTGWQKFFEGFEFALKYRDPLNGQDLSLDGEGAQAGELTDRPSISGAGKGALRQATDSLKEGFSGLRKELKDFADRAPNLPSFPVDKEFKVLNMIQGYRTRGHLFTKTNPVRERRKYYPGKELVTFGLSEDDLDTVFQAGSELGIGPATLRQIRQVLEDTYCQSIGAEFMFIRNPIKVKWLTDRIEKNSNKPGFVRATKMRILKKLNQAVVFENFLHTKYVGQKRFSLEGAEGVIPALDNIIQKGAELGIEEFVIGMAHRGRLNVLANILNKTYKEIFSEFEGKLFEEENVQFGGDVKYHLGYSSDIDTNIGTKVHLTLACNPSHLEAVDPVVEGITRAKAEHKYKGNSGKIAPILIHGDASIAGQGVVYEVAQMAKLKGYRTGGTIHLVINNQVGFTTNYLDGRSSTYCTDIAKVTLSPVFHVNGDDAEALAHAIQIAMEYRQEFHSDIYIDVLCYRKYGHNEADDPRFTQPTLYKEIARHPNPRDIYIDKLIAEGTLTKEDAKKLEQEFRSSLQTMLDEVKTLEKTKSNGQSYQGAWKGFRPSTDKDFDRSPDTGVDKKSLLGLAKTLFSYPDSDKIFNKLKKIYDERRKTILEDQVCDWAIAEHLAYASLVTKGHAVRLAGQDSIRGTFSHRHAELKFEGLEDSYFPLQNLSKDQAPCHIYNSFLSEYACLGFEYGYSLATPNHLTLWEAQFGDFVNGAQIIIDQFIASGAYKWNKASGLVMLLPHGYEGQGPEHSSARIERFLELCGHNNMQVVNCTTPANFFHVLRRQLIREFRVPLIVFTPKSLLRHAECVSPLEDLTKGGFQELLDDPRVKDAKKVKKLILCSGKIYYDLEEHRRNNKVTHVALVRLEQMYPCPDAQIQALLKKYQVDSFTWVQEEPENMGAWPFICRHFRSLRPEVISRPQGASPATGYLKKHLYQQKELLEKALS